MQMMVYVANANINTFYWFILRTFFVYLHTIHIFTYNYYFFVFFYYFSFHPFLCSGIFCLVFDQVSLDPLQLHLLSAWHTNPAVSLDRICALSPGCCLHIDALLRRLRINIQTLANAVVNTAASLFFTAFFKTTTVVKYLSKSQMKFFDSVCCECGLMAWWLFEDWNSRCLLLWCHAEQ